jgi:hypothetical protein
VDHEAAGQPPGRRGHRLPGRQAIRVAGGPQLPAGGEDLRPAAPVDRAVHATTAEQRGIRRVDDSVDLLLGDVAAHQFQAHTPTILSARRRGAGPPPPHDNAQVRLVR